MSQVRSNRLLRPETVTAFGIILVAAAFLIPAADMDPISALLPVSMIVGLVSLSVILLISDQRKAANGEDARKVTTAPRRVIGAFLLIVCYALAVDFLGFYGSTAVVIPLVAYIFGYRSPLGLLAATAIVLGAIYLIFDFAMSQEFPVGRVWEM